MRRKGERVMYGVKFLRWYLFIAVFFGLIIPPNVHAFTLNVRGVDWRTTPPDVTSAENYRWVVEEDTTYHVQFDGSGNPITPGPWTFGGQLNPQLQPDNGNEPYRVETGPVLTQAFQGFLGQTSVMQWGNRAYGPGPDGEFRTTDDQNGGVSGIVYYATTRAEDDPANVLALKGGEK
jgi:hypothetical protein